MNGNLVNWIEEKTARSIAFYGRGAEPVSRVGLLRYINQNQFHAAGTAGNKAASSYYIREVLSDELLQLEMANANTAVFTTDANFGNMQPYKHTHRTITIEREQTHGDGAWEADFKDLAVDS